VNPYDGSRTSYGGGNRTPAWSSGAKTPAYGLQQDGFAAGSKTPGYGGGGDTWGSKTPAYQHPTPSNDNWGSNQPAPSGWGGNSYDAPTPGAHMSAPTPTAMNAPTPGAYSAPTPAPYNAPTPAAAPTPAPSWGSSMGTNSSGNGCTYPWSPTRLLRSTNARCLWNARDTSSKLARRWTSLRRLKPSGRAFAWAGYS
jgi:hypothetical protein